MVDCTITDTFLRPDQDLDGSTADSGLTWYTVGAGVSIVSNKGVMVPNSSGCGFVSPPLVPIGYARVYSFKFKITSLLNTTGTHQLVMSATPTGHVSDVDVNVLVALRFNSTSAHTSDVRITRTDETGTATDILNNVTWTVGTEYTVEVRSNLFSTTVTVSGLGTFTCSRTIGDGAVQAGGFDLGYSANHSFSDPAPGNLEFWDVALAESPGCVSTSAPCGCLPFDPLDTIEPARNQPIHDEPVGVGDGFTTVFTTAWPYSATSLEVNVDGLAVGGDPDDPTTGQFVLSFAPAVGDAVTASYRRAP